MNCIFWPGFRDNLLAGLLSLGLGHAALAQTTDPLAAAGTYVERPA